MLRKRIKTLCKFSFISHLFCFAFVKRGNSINNICVKDGLNKKSQDIIRPFFKALWNVKSVISSTALMHESDLHERLSIVDTKMWVFRSEKGKLSRLTLTSEGLIFKRAFYFSSGISVLVIYLATQRRQVEALKMSHQNNIHRMSALKKKWTEGTCTQTQGRR